jgi:transposase
MANKPIEMSKIRQILRLYSKGIGKRKIASRVGSSKNTVNIYIDNFIKLRLTVEEAMKLSDLELNNLFHPPRVEYTSERAKELLDFFPEAARMLRRRGVTRMFVYAEYKKQHPEGYCRSQFYELFARWSNKVKPVMHIEHIAGDKIYVDYAGAKWPYACEDTGEILEAEIFVAILGWSQYAYVEALRGQTVPDFIAGCENAFHYFGGTSLALVPDNLKSAVTKTDRYEPTINENFNRFSDHYSIAVLPARARKPQDKAPVENMVKLAYQRIYARLPADKIFTLKELNAHMHQFLAEHNDMLIKDLGASRKDRWMIEKIALNPLPERRYEMKTIRVVTVHKSCHILLSEDKHHYSVPYQLIGKKVKLIYSQSLVEVYDNYRLIASHKRVRSSGNYTTDSTHLPPEHQHILNWSPEQYIIRARQIDPVVESYIRKVLEKKVYPQQAYKSCDGILSFDKKIGRERLIKACKRADEIGHYGYKVIENILKRGIDQYEFEEINAPMPSHQNVRNNYN